MWVVWWGVHGVGLAELKYWCGARHRVKEGCGGGFEGWVVWEVRHGVTVAVRWVTLVIV